MNIIPRQFVLVASELMAGHSDLIPALKQLVVAKTICYAEYTALVRWEADDRISKIIEERSDPIHGPLAERWEKFANKYKIDLEDANDPEWNDIDQQINTWWDAKLDSLIEELDPELAEIKQKNPRAFAALACCGGTSLFTDADIIPTKVLLMPDQYHLRFQVMEQRESRSA